MRHLDEGTIHAWLDGALRPEESAALEEHIAECDACARAVGEARGLIAASSRILSALDAVPAGVLPAAPEGVGVAPARAPRRWLSPYARVAAAVVFVAAGTFAVVRSMGERGEPRLASSASNEAPQAAPSTEVQPLAAPAATPSAAPSPAPAPGAARRRVAAATSTETRESQTAGEPGASRLLRAKTAAPRAAAKTDVASSAAVSIPSTADEAASGAVAPPPVPLASKEYPDTSAVTDTSHTLHTLTLAPGTVGEPRIRLVRTDTVATLPSLVQRKTYEVRPGVRVALDVAASAPQRQEQPSARTLSERARSNEPVARAAGVNSIRWTDSTGTEFTLFGPLPIEELKKLKPLVH